jgi:hypothetical protein
MSKYVVTLDDPSLARGQKVHVPGLGELTNKSKVVVDEGQASQFRRYNGVVGPSGLELGPTLLKANLGPYIQVEVVRDEAPQAAPDAPVVSDNAKTGDGKEGTK